MGSYLTDTEQAVLDRLRKVTRALEGERRLLLVSAGTSALVFALLGAAAVIR